MFELTLKQFSEVPYFLKFIGYEPSAAVKTHGRNGLQRLCFSLRATQPASLNVFGFEISDARPTKPCILKRDHPESLFCLPNSLQHSPWSCTFRSQNVLPDRRPMTFLDTFADFGLTHIRAWSAARKLACGIEQSVRMSQKIMETRRCLISFSLAAAGHEAAADVTQICRAMNAPETFLQSVARFINAAAFVHFGFEHSGTTRIGKCYLELPPPAPSQTRQSGRLQFLGFKWSLQDSSIAVVSRYRSSIVQDWSEIKSVLLTATDHKLRPILDSLLQQLQPSSQQAAEIYPLLEISEEGSDRSSWDLNVYDGQWSLGQIQSCLLAAVETLQISQQEFFPWILPITTSALGHIATGIGRNGEPFLTVYYGARGVEAL